MLRRLVIPLFLLVAAAAVPVLSARAQEVSTEPVVAEVPLSADAVPVAPGWEEDVPVEANLVAVEWTGDPAAEFTIEVRRDDDVWRPVGSIGEVDNGPDDGTAEAAAAAQLPTTVSEPLWTNDVSAVRVQLTDGTAGDVTLVAIDSPPTAPVGGEVQQAGALAGSLLAVAAAGVVVAFVTGRRRLVALGVLAALVAAGCAPLKPPGGGGGAPAGAAVPGSIVPRSQWGGDLPWRYDICPEGPTIASRLNRAVVHHTVNSNFYGPEHSVQIIRGIWAHHAQTNGWCDIGYNFLIDRYGRIFEGRRGGIAKAVVGAHAVNSNTGTTGIAFIGDHRVAPVPGSSQGSMINLISWKFVVHLTNPQAGDAIVGHRDVYSTECPGNAAYSLLPGFRNAVRQRVPWNRSPVGNFESATRKDPTKIKVHGWALDPDTTASIRFRVSVDSGNAGEFTANLSRPDLRASYPYNGDRHGFDVVATVPPGPQTVCVTALNHTAGGSSKLLGCRNVP